MRGFVSIQRIQAMSLQQIKASHVVMIFLNMAFSLFQKCLSSYSVLKLQLKTYLQGQEASRKRGTILHQEEMYYILTPLACSFIKKFPYFNLINLINFFIAGVYSVSTAILDVCHFLCSYLLHSTNCYIHNKSLFCLVITY